VAFVTEYAEEKWVRHLLRAGIGEIPVLAKVITHLTGVLCFGVGCVSGLLFTVRGALPE